MARPLTLESKTEEFRELLEPVSLAQIPQWSPWPGRLLGVDSWQTTERTIEKVKDEYDRDKYAKCLKYLDANPQSKIEDVKQFEFGQHGDARVLVSIKDQLFWTTQQVARKLHYVSLTNKLIEINRHSTINTIVELGAGYGFNLHLLSESVPGVQNFVGKELSANAVKLGNRLADSNPTIELHEFDFCESDDYNFLTQLAGPVLVYTCHAVEQLASFKVVAKNLAKARDQIHSVVHFEPQHQLHPNSLMGLMRQRYAEMNDYNLDLMTVLREDSEIEILSREMDVYGLNPFNPTSVVHWQFK